MKEGSVGPWVCGPYPMNFITDVLQNAGRCEIAEMEATKTKAKTKMKDEKRKRFHAALLHFYDPHEGSTSPPPSPLQAHFEEPPSFNYDPVSGDEVEEMNCVGDSTDCEPKKLTRAQRKRVRKRKLKEAASVRRKIVGPLFPAGYQDSQEEQSSDKMDPSQEDNHSHLQDTTTS